MSDETKQRIEQLRTYLDSDELHIEGRLFVLNEIWDMKIATAATVARK